jgi:ferrous iron transport protein A
VALKKRKKYNPPLDKNFGRGHTETKMQLSGNNHLPETFCGTLVDLRRGDRAILDRIDLPGEDARRLMELGFLPGTTITAGFSAPGGDPRVFQVDGSEIALRSETARRMMIRQTKQPKGKTPRIS